MNIKKLLFLIISLLALTSLVLAISELPPYGEAANPVHNKLVKRYITKGLEDTGVYNMVTGIVLDYRAYDTMFETIVLFTATVAVVISLKPFGKKEDKN